MNCIYPYKVLSSINGRPGNACLTLLYLLRRYSNLYCEMTRQAVWDICVPWITCQHPVIWASLWVLKKKILFSLLCYIWGLDALHLLGLLRHCPSKFKGSNTDDFAFFQAWIYHCHLHPLQAANCCRNSRLVVDEDDMKWVTYGKNTNQFHKNVRS